MIMLSSFCLPPIFCFGKSTLFYISYTITFKTKFFIYFLSKKLFEYKLKFQATIIDNNRANKNLKIFHFNP